MLTQVGGLSQGETLHYHVGCAVVKTIHPASKEKGNSQACPQPWYSLLQRITR